MKKKFGSWKNPHFSVPAIIAMVIGGLALAFLFAFLFGWGVMYLWNWLMPEIFGLPRIGYWQAWGLVLLSHILLKGGWGSGSGGSCGDKKKSKHHNDCEWHESGWKENLAERVDEKNNGQSV